MDRNELNSYNELILQSATPENQAVVTEIMTKISEGFEAVFTKLETAENSVSELTKNNETLREVNAKLFLKVGTVGAGSPNTPEPPTDTPEQVLNYDDLFSDSGELL